eukprot:TRINITY_DN1511_c1_g3_i1.p1 TRINITY_DN1511_c1_g3~~TRINITY_DN1511_c1_g3_i1.p1  ORF type:complete len:517 (-),score=145.58 TRINITY_DN1511_c1_g3_i1:86-1636(-)
MFKLNYKIILLCLILILIQNIETKEANKIDINSIEDESFPYPMDKKWGTDKTNKQVLEMMKQFNKIKRDNYDSKENGNVESSYSENKINSNEEIDNQREAIIEYHRIEENFPPHSFYSTFITGNLWILENPINHFSILQPNGGCGTLTRPSETSKTNQCLVATNAGFFNTHTYECNGNLVSNNEVIQNTGLQNANFGLSKEGKFVTGYINEDQVQDQEGFSLFNQLVAGVVWVVKDGQVYVDESWKIEDQSTQETGSNFCTIQSARNVIGHDDLGRLFILTIDGKSYERGLSLYQMGDLLLDLEVLNVVNAINLDGGGSAVSTENSTVISYPSDECPSPNERFHCERAVSSITCFHDFIVDIDYTNQTSLFQDDDDEYYSPIIGDDGPSKSDQGENNLNITSSISFENGGSAKSISVEDRSSLFETTIHDNDSSYENNNNSSYENNNDSSCENNNDKDSDNDDHSSDLNLLLLIGLVISLMVILISVVLNALFGFLLYKKKKEENDYSFGDDNELF